MKHVIAYLRVVNANRAAAGSDLMRSDTTLRGLGYGRDSRSSLGSRMCKLAPALTR